MHWPSANNDLFILNTFITNSLAGIGLIDSAAVVNAPEFLMNYCLQCVEETGKRPNFVTIDFHEVGDPFAVVDELNDLPLLLDGLLGSKVHPQNLKVYPNPTQNAFFINQGVNTVQVYDITGKLVKAFNGNFSENYAFDISNLTNSIYILKLINELGVQHTTKLIKL